MVKIQERPLHGSGRGRKESSIYNTPKDVSITKAISRDKDLARALADLGKGTTPTPAPFNFSASSTRGGKNPKTVHRGQDFR